MASAQQQLPLSKKASLDALALKVMAGTVDVYVSSAACVYDVTWSRGVYNDAQNPVSHGVWMAAMHRLPSVAWVPVPDAWVLPRLAERKVFKKAKQGTEEMYACRSCATEFPADAASSAVRHVLECSNNTYCCISCAKLPHTVLQALFVRNVDWNVKVLLEFEDEIFLAMSMQPVQNSSAYSCVKLGPTTYLPLLQGKLFNLMLPKQPRVCLDCYTSNLQMMARGAGRFEDVIQIKNLHKTLHALYVPPQRTVIMLVADADYFCAGCNMAGSSIQHLKLCSRCKRTFYCSSACSKQHWKAHKRECNSDSS